MAQLHKRTKLVHGIKIITSIFTTRTPIERTFSHDPPHTVFTNNILYEKLILRNYKYEG